MVPHQIDTSGICTTCQANVSEQQLIECYDCKNKYHADECDNKATFCSKSNLKIFKGLQRNRGNFIFICDGCITRRELNVASSMKDQLEAVVESVALLTKEVKSLKNGNLAPQPASKEANTSVIPTPSMGKGVPPAWTDQSRTENIKKKFKEMLYN